MIGRRSLVSIGFVVLLVGCGGSRVRVDVTKLQRNLAGDVHLKLMPRGDYDVTATCVHNGKDGFHFECLATAQNKKNAVDTLSLSYTVVCDTSGGGTCLWRLEPAGSSAITGSEGTASSATDRGTTRSAPAKLFRIVYPEGFTRRDMAKRISEVDRIMSAKGKVRLHLSETAYLSLTDGSTPPTGFVGAGRLQSLEGFLFPGTYGFLDSTPTRQLVRDQLAAFQRAWSQVDMRSARSKGMSAYDVLIIASIVEKEALVPKERPLIAAVIYNRLKAQMPIGIDASLRYGLNLKPTDSLAPYIDSPSPYNLGNHNGLPPTPISNPGLASMWAAAHPASVKYLYYLRKPDGVNHYFTASYEDFVSHEREYGYIK